ncbi:MAG: hypothetical protein IPJ27_24900 [Candidatus Accumulibacter sp.]|uniref:Uncharacterized protein n=1 Tax=Candidatus Accumulibacter proximus TaxID=2954385 RepID=A0A935Q508_9PROT|nr:hypothetical protein [Candidatus Accumulibacter proximus]
MSTWNEQIRRRCSVGGSRGRWQGSGREPPRKVAERVVAAGDGSTIARSAEGRMWAREGSRGPRQIALDRRRAESTLPG